MIIALGSGYSITSCIGRICICKKFIQMPPRIPDKSIFSCRLELKLQRARGRDRHPKADSRLWQERGAIQYRPRQCQRGMRSRRHAARRRRWTFGHVRTLPDAGKLHRPVAHLGGIYRKPRYLFVVERHLVEPHRCQAKPIFAEARNLLLSGIRRRIRSGPLQASLSQESNRSMRIKPQFGADGSAY